MRENNGRGRWRTPSLPSSAFRAGEETRGALGSRAGETGASGSRAGKEKEDRGSPREQGDTAVVAEPKTRQKLARPPLYRVLLHNDDFTPMEFVVSLLETVFQRSESEALAIMLHAHTTGIAVAGVYTFEIAEVKVDKVSTLADEAGFPLLCTLEPESDGNGE